VAFIRRKRTTAGIVYQVVRQDWVDDKPCQRVLVSLSHSPTIAARLVEVERLLAGGGLNPYWTARYRVLHERLRAVQAETGLP
jgi:hypothetical protein